MKKKPRLTKREKKQIAPPRPPAKRGGGAQAQAQGDRHIHCTACGRHIDPPEFDEARTAQLVSCQHGTQFASCTACVARTQELLDEHDRSGQPVQPAAAWH